MPASGMQADVLRPRGVHGPSLGRALPSRYDFGAWRVQTGICRSHLRAILARIQRKGAGAIEGRRPPMKDEIARFWSKVQKTESCWLWEGAKDAKGYGLFYPHRGSKIR